MFVSSNRALVIRNILLLAAGLSICLALIWGWPPWAVFCSPTVLLGVFLALVSGFPAASGIREFAGLLFKLDRGPWYAQPGGWVFLAAMLIGVNAAGYAGLTALASWWVTFSVLPEHSLILLALASQLVSVTVLDWPQKQKVPIVSNEPKQRSTCPSFDISTPSPRRALYPAAKRKRIRKKRKGNRLTR